MAWLSIGARVALPRQVAAEDDPPDVALVAAAQADPGAFVALVERDVDRVYAYCHARLGDREAAEDATSEVFTRALCALGRYRDGLFAAWLFRIARNVVAAAQRRRPVAPLAAGDERAAIELAQAGWSGEAMAAQLGRSPAAVQQLRYRAMRRLQLILTRAGHAPEEARDA